MANYSNNLYRINQLLKECQDTTVTFKGQTPELVVANTSNNIYPLYAKDGSILCLVTSYVSKKSQSAYESSTLYNDAVLMAVNLEQSGEDTIMTYIGAAMAVPFEDFCQSVFNVTGLIQTGPAVYGLEPVALDMSGTLPQRGHSSHRSGAGSYIASQTDTSILGAVKYLISNPAGALSDAGDECLSMLRRYTESEEDMVSFFSKELINLVFGGMRDEGMWDKTYEKLTNFTVHAALMQIEASLEIAAEQFINGTNINGHVYIPTAEESEIYYRVWNYLVSNFASIGVGHNMFFGGRTGYYTNENKKFVCSVSLVCVRTSSNPNSLYAVNIFDNGAGVSLQRYWEPPYQQLGDSVECDNYQCSCTFVRDKVGDPFVLESAPTYKSRLDGYKLNSLVISRAIVKDYFSGCAASANRLGWVRQDPTVTPPSNAGDTIENTYNEWNLKFQPQVQVSLDPQISLEPYIELKPTISVYLPESQPTHEESTSGTIINNEGDTVINNNEYITNNVVNYYITNQYITNPGGEVVTTPTTTPTTPGVVDTNVPDIGEIETPDPPTIVASEGNFYNVYFPLIDQVNAFNSWLWSPSILDTIIKYVSNPMGAILSFGMFYADYPANSLEFVNGINLGNMTYKPSSGGSQFARATELATVVDCGSVTLNHTFNSALDYEPFLSVGAYLPFVGEVQWSAADVVNSIISVRYNIDIITGSALCIVSVNKLDASGTKTNFSVPLYMYECNCLVSIPLAQSDFSRLYSSIAGALIGGALGAAGVSASESVMAARTPGMSAELAGAIDRQNAIGRTSDAISSVGNILGNTQIPIVQQGHVGVSAGALGPKKPILIIRRRNAYMADGYQEYEGYPANNRYTIGQLKGFTRVKDVHVQGIPATEQELVMIEAALKEGVIL